MTDVRHLEGKANVVADALSWFEMNQVLLTIDFGQLVQAQLQDPEI